MAAAQELLVNRLKTAPAVPRREPGRNDKPVMVLLLLALSGLMALEAVDALLRVQADLVLVHHGELLLDVALGAFAGRANERRGRLRGFHPRPLAVHEEGRDNQREADRDRDEDGSKRHTAMLHAVGKSGPGKQRERRFASNRRECALWNGFNHESQILSNPVWNFTRRPCGYLRQEERRHD